MSRIHNCKACFNHRMGVFTRVAVEHTCSDNGASARQKPKFDRMTPIHEIQLPDNGDEFSQRFNYVSALFRKSQDESLSQEERERWSKEYDSAKYCLEQGLPMSFLNIE